MRAPRTVCHAATRGCSSWRSLKQVHQIRAIHISTTPASTNPDLGGTFESKLDPSSMGEHGQPDARFEILGSPFSLLSISLSASQNLYTRRGTLVGVSGKSENAISVLSVLEPFRRVVLRIPFLYQRISSTTPLTALVSTQSPMTSFAILHLDGTTDWMVAQRKALVAWTGQNLSTRPVLNRQMSIAHWGNTEVTGRGLLALSGQGQIYQVILREEEEFVAHPSNIVAYSMTRNPPLPYRLKSSVLKLQIPDLGLSKYLPQTKFFQVLWASDSWKAIRKIFFTLRTWSRRTIWGDRLFLRFRGPATILLQSRASRLSDTLTTQDVNEIADTPPASAEVKSILEDRPEKVEEIMEKGAPARPSTPPSKMTYASVGRDGKVAFKGNEGSSQGLS